MKYPADSDLERIVLGQMLISPDACYAVVDILQPQSFNEYRNRTIFNAIQQLVEAGESIDLVTVTDQLKKTSKLEALDQDGENGVYYISQLTNKVAGTANAPRHARILEELRIKRAQLKLSQEIQQSIEAGDDPFEIDEFITQMQVEMLSNIKSNQAPSIKDLAAQIRDEVVRASEQKGITGIPTGMPTLDNIYGGRQQTDLIIVGGRPAMGKTAYVLSQAHRQSVWQHYHSVIFSLEMSAGQLLKRIASAESGVNASKIKFGNLSTDDWSKFDTALGKLEKSNLHIFDKAFDLTSILTIARRMKMQKKCDIIYLDYIQLVGSSGYNKEDRVSTISRSLKLLAKALDVPVVALSQLNRGVEQRGGDKRPMVSDLRDSGAIEQDADVIELVNRPEQNGITQFADGSPTAGIAEIIIGKNRAGMTDTVQLRWHAETTRFSDFNEYNGGDNSKAIEPNGDFDEPPF